MTNGARMARLIVGAHAEMLRDPLGAAQFDWDAHNRDMDARRDKLAATEREIAAGHAAAMSTLGEAIALIDAAVVTASRDLWAGAGASASAPVSKQEPQP